MLFLSKNLPTTLFEIKKKNKVLNVACKSLHHLPPNTVSLRIHFLLHSSHSLQPHLIYYLFLEQKRHNSTSKFCSCYLLCLSFLRNHAFLSLVLDFSAQILPHHKSPFWLPIQQTLLTLFLSLILAFFFFMEFFTTWNIYVSLIYLLFPHSPVNSNVRSVRQTVCVTSFREDSRHNFDL